MEKLIIRAKALGWWLYIALALDVALITGLIWYFLFL
jgi:hypothetical protein